MFDDQKVYRMVSKRAAEIAPGIETERCVSGAWMFHRIPGVPQNVTVLATPFWDSNNDLWIVVDDNAGQQKTVLSAPMPTDLRGFSADPDFDARRDADFILKTMRDSIALIVSAAEGS